MVLIGKGLAWWESPAVGLGAWVLGLVLGLGAWIWCLDLVFGSGACIWRLYFGVRALHFDVSACTFVRYTIPH